MKCCKKCNIEKELTEFNKGSGKYSLHTICRSCQKINSQEYNKNNRYKKTQKQKEWAKNSPNKVREIKKKYRKENREKLNEEYKKYIKNNRCKANKYSKDTTEKLATHYVVRLLKKQGWPKEVIAEDLIELNKSIIKIKRYVKDKTSKESI